MDAETAVRLPAPKVCRRYDITPRTLDRWLEREALNFPRPLVINRRRYWPLDSLIAWELAQAANAAGATA
jgi:hypothetical protein